MGSGRRAASEKCSRNQGLAHVPAMFGPDNPAQPTGFWRLSEHQLAAGNREILPLAGLSALRGLPSDGAQSRRAARSRRSRRGGWSRPPTAWIRRLSSLACRSRPRRANPARSMAATPSWSNSNMSTAAWANVPSRTDRSAPPPAHARRRGAAIRPQPRPFEARIDVRGIVEPRHAAREERGGEPGPRYREQRPQQAHVATARPGPPCRPDRRDRSGGQPAWPRSRPDRRRDGRAAGAGCRAGGIRRATAGSGPSAPPPAGQPAAWRPTR